MACAGGASATASWVLGLLCVGLARGLPIGPSAASTRRRKRRYREYSGRQRRHGEQLRSAGAWWLGLVGHGCRQALDVRLRLSVQAQQARQVVCRAGWNGRARLALPLAVRYPQQRRAFAGFFNVDLVGAVGVVRRIAGAVIAVFPAQLESAAPGLALVQAGLACAHPELAYPQAVFSLSHQSL